MRNKQSGFSTIEVIVIIAIAALLVLGGWYFWQRTQTSTSSDNRTPHTESAQQASDEKGEKQYLVIKEWDVQLPLNDEISDAYYVFEGDFISIRDTSFDNMKNTDGVSCSGWDNMLYTIARAKSQDVAAITDPTNPAYTGPSAPYRAFPFSEEYQFSGLGPHQAAPECAHLDSGSLDKSIIEAEGKKEQAFEAAFDQLQPVN